MVYKHPLCLFQYCGMTRALCCVVCVHVYVCICMRVRVCMCVRACVCVHVMLQKSLMHEYTSYVCMHTRHPQLLYMLCCSAHNLMTT